MKKTFIITIVIVSLLLFLSFLIWSHSQRYKGDGVLTDKGPMAAIDRYVLDLGKIQLNRKGEYSYFISNLPQEEMTVGLGITDDVSFTDNLKDKLKVKFPITIKIKLTNGEGKIVINEEGALHDWVWDFISGTNYHFVYKPGQVTEIKTGENSTYSRPTGVKADAGWGTYFTPRKRESYKLTVAVFPTGNARIARMANVQVKGGGWK
jgi:hypothetical protein